eukprot:10025493-Alexandrium_andersonii.AAC.1
MSLWTDVYPSLRPLEGGPPAPASAAASAVVSPPPPPPLKSPPAPCADGAGLRWPVPSRFTAVARG